MTRKLALLGVVVVAAAVAAVLLFFRETESSPVPTGGACDYQKFAGTCPLTSTDAKAAEAPDSGTVVSATYALPGDRPRSWSRSWLLPAARVTAFVAHLEKNSPAPCAGEVIVRGSCKPWTAEITVPPFDGARPR